jgi:SAM-dependent methyltransferase
MASCFICAGTSFDQATPQYRRCRNCGHETLQGAPVQTYMLNDALDKADAARPSLLDRFQDAILRRFGVGAEDGLWVDIGSGSGRLLHRNQGRFTRHCGVEVTPAAVEFSRCVLGLDIVTNLADAPGEIAFATAWHSLEHFPATALESLLTALRAKLRAGGRIIVSVPNGASFQYRLFRRRYAFFDVPNHLQQFTPDSLQRLFAAHGFTITATIVSWPYNIFGYVQALLNLTLRDHNYLYYRLKRRTAKPSRLRDLANLLLLPLFVPAGLTLALLDAASPARQGVLTCCFEKCG